MYVIWSLCERCRSTETAPAQWLKGIMFPIHKKGDKRNPYNYRGITLLSVVSKIYETILTKRLSKWCEKMGNNSRRTRGI